jgi:hypothetical protein
MKVGTLTFETAIEKLYKTHAIMCDQLGEFVSVQQTDDTLQVYTQTGDDMYEFLKSQNETVQVCSTISSSSTYQYMRMHTEDGDEMDFFLFEPAPIITMDELLHPVS